MAHLVRGGGFPVLLPIHIVVFRVRVHSQVHAIAPADVLSVVPPLVVVTCRSSVFLGTTELRGRGTFHDIQVIEMRRSLGGPWW